MKTTKDVLDRHLKCFGDGDLEGIVSDYEPDAILFTPDGPLRGRDAIRDLFAAMLAEFGKPGTTFDLARCDIDGNLAYITWAAATADNVYELGTDTFFVREGRIAVQSFAARTTRRA